MSEMGTKNRGLADWAWVPLSAKRGMMHEIHKFPYLWALYELHDFEEASKYPSVKFRLVGLKLIQDAYEDFAKIFGFGNQKYAPGNWLKGYEWTLSISACYRHLLKGDELDPESGLPHRLHAAWHFFVLAEFMDRNLGIDDRPWVPGRHRNETQLTV